MTTRSNRSPEERRARAREIAAELSQCDFLHEEVLGELPGLRTLQTELNAANLEISRLKDQNEKLRDRVYDLNEELRQKEESK